MKILYNLLLLSCAFSARAAQTSVSDNNDYPRACELAAVDPNLFSNFRNSLTCRQIVETVSPTQGQKYLSIIKEQSPSLIEKMGTLKSGDRFGAPHQHSFDEIGFIAPTTLRYIKVASDLQTIFGSLDNCTVVEIGGGYGGQCKILSDLYKYKKYIIIDLPGPLALTKKFLHENGIDNVTLISALDPLPTMECDLVISNYAYSELKESMRKKYHDAILSHSKAGYLTCNVASNESFPSKNQLLGELTALDISWKQLPENPLTDANNYLVIWNRMKL